MTPPSRRPALALSTTRQQVGALVLDTLTAGALLAAPQLAMLVGEPYQSADPQRGVAIGLAMIYLWGVGVVLMGGWLMVRDLAPPGISPGRRLMAGGPIAWVTADGAPATGSAQGRRLAWRLLSLLLTGLFVSAAAGIGGSPVGLLAIALAWANELRIRLLGDGRSWPDRRAGLWLVRLSAPAPRPDEPIEAARARRGADDRAS